jgi:hypothetical protein
MTSQELAGSVKDIIEKAQSRILGIGSEQYSLEENRNQKFEEYSINKMFEQFEEEILDVINYAVMLNLKLASLQERVRSVDDQQNDLSPTP